MQKPKYLNIIQLTIYIFAFVGVVLSVLLAVIIVRPVTLELIGFKEESSSLYSCMTYHDPALLQRIYNGEIDLKEAREIANAQTDIADEYTKCLEDIFGYHQVWIDTNSFIIYD